VAAAAVAHDGPPSHSVVPAKEEQPPNSQHESQRKMEAGTRDGDKPAEAGPVGTEGAAAAAAAAAPTAGSVVATAGGDDKAEGTVRRRHVSGDNDDDVELLHEMILWLHAALLQLGCPMFSTPDELRSALTLREVQQPPVPRSHGFGTHGNRNTIDTNENGDGGDGATNSRDAREDCDVDGGFNSRQFVDAVRWLEGRRIRLYSAEERVRLFERSASSFAGWEAARLVQYLDDLECPYCSDRPEKEGFDDNGCGGDNANSGASDISLFSPDSLDIRIRALYWLTVCATSEAYGDSHDDVGAATAAAAAAAAAFPPQGAVYCTAPQYCVEPDGVCTDGTRSNGPDDEALRRRLDRDFPLGFTSGDPEVDRALAVTRMVHLLELEEVEDDPHPPSHPHHSRLQQPWP
jgi:RNA transcription, translation and transport factor protein